MVVMVSGCRGKGGYEFTLKETSEGFSNPCLISWDDFPIFDWKSEAYNLGVTRDHLSHWDCWRGMRHQPLDRLGRIHFGLRRPCVALRRCYRWHGFATAFHSAVSSSAARFLYFHPGFWGCFRMFQDVPVGFFNHLFSMWRQFGNPN